LEIVVLNGARTRDAKVDKTAQTLTDTINTFGHVSLYRLRDIEVKDCLGCFGCWVKTPGECVIEDGAQEIINKLPLTDLSVYVSPVVFGGYSYDLKKVLDRQICGILPFFHKVNGELHHPQRYDKIGKLAAIGVLPKPDPQAQEIFSKLLYRNSLNKQASRHATAFVYEKDTQKQVEEKISQLLAELEVKA
jgi:multimeric flavodoxin WrbA